MELKISEFQLPQAIIFNYEEIKQELLKKADDYASIVYTESQIKDAKVDRANLNRLKKALNDERIKREKEYMQPFNDFKSKINEIVSIIDKPCAVIDAQVKAFEEKAQEEKLNKITEYFATKEVPQGITLEAVLENRWLNASVSIKTVQEEIDSKLAQIEKDIHAIKALPTYSFEALQVYKSTLDLAAAVDETSRLRSLAEEKAAAEAQRASATEQGGVGAGEQTAPEVNNDCGEWVSFRALLTVDNAQALAAWFAAKNIEYEAI